MSLPPEPTASEQPPADRANTWQLRTRRLSFDALPLLMGIVNVTPDSFSDGGKFRKAPSAIEYALRLIEEGADVIDIGGESTRPYSEPVAEQEELDRVLPVVEAIAAQSDTPISIDTSKASVAQAAVEAGAEIINDVTGLEGDPQMIRVALQTQAGVCAMHMQGSPQTMQDDPCYEDVVNDIFEYLRQRRDQLLSAGLDPARVCLDPGIGFGKTHTHNLELLQRCQRFHELGHPLLVGHSRKGFIAHVMQDRQADRTAGTIGVSLTLALRGIQILRVHDVAATGQALQLFKASGGLE